MLKWIIYITIVLLLSLCFLSISTAYDTTSVLNTAKSYLYVRENTNHNDAPEVNKFLKYVGLGPHFPYCLAFAQFCWGQHYKPSPYPVTGGTVHFMELVKAHPLRYKIYTAEDFAMGRGIGAVGGIGIFFHNSKTGHAFILEKPLKLKGMQTIEGNTVSSSKGTAAEQRGEGKTKKAQGVFRKVRTTRSAPGWEFKGVVLPR